MNVIEFTGDTPGNVVVPSEYWKVNGAVPVKFIVIGVCEPLHIDAVPDIDAVGLGDTVMVIGDEALTQPDAAFRTVNAPIYKPAGIVFGIVNETGEAVKVALTISVKPAVWAAGSKSILNSSADPVTAPYVKVAVVAPAHTGAMLGVVIVGTSFTVTFRTVGVAALQVLST